MLFDSSLLHLGKARFSFPNDCKCEILPLEWQEFIYSTIDIFNHCYVPGMGDSAVNKLDASSHRAQILVCECVGGFTQTINTLNISRI